MKNNPFTPQEIERYMNSAIASVNENHPSATGSQWDDRVKEQLRRAHNGEKNMESHDAHLFSELIWDGYYYDE